MRRETLQALLDAQAAGRAVALVTPLDGSAQRVIDAADVQPMDADSAALAAAVREALLTDRAVLLPWGSTQALVSPWNPPLHLVIVGAVHIAEALCRMARIAGYQVTLIEPRSGFARTALFPDVRLLNEWPQQAFASIQCDSRTAVVLLTHDPKIDDPALDCVRGRPVFYIGALGSTRTQARRLERLAARGWSAEELARIQGPAGLAIGARTPAEIALSILAQLTQALRARRA